MVSLFWGVCVAKTRKKSVPRNDVSVRHFVEQLLGFSEMAGFDVAIDQGVPRDGVSRVGRIVEQFACVVEIAVAHEVVNLVIEIESKSCVGVESSSGKESGYLFWSAH